MGKHNILHAIPLATVASPAIDSNAQYEERAVVAWLDSLKPPSLKLKLRKRNRDNAPDSSIDRNNLMRLLGSHIQMRIRLP